MNLAEYRHRSQSLADFLPWAALVEKGVILNKDGSFQRSARFRGPDLDSVNFLVIVRGQIGAGPVQQTASRFIQQQDRAPRAVAHQFLGGSRQHFENLRQGSVARSQLEDAVFRRKQFQRIRRACFNLERKLTVPTPFQVSQA